MLKNLKYFLQHSAIYSIGNIATKAMGVVLLPIYSSYLTLAQFGVLGILEISIMILTEVLNFGLAVALLKFHNDTEFENKKDTVVFTIFSTSFIFCIVFLLIGLKVIPYFSNFFEYSKDFSGYFRFGLIVIILRILNNVLLSKIRADERSVLYTVLNLIRLFGNIGFIAYFLVVKKMGIEGVLFAYIIGESIIFLFLLPSIIIRIKFNFDFHISKLALAFGFPLIFSSMAMMLLNLSDRYVLKFFENYSVLGLYDLGYRVAGVINMFLIVPLNLALLPIAYKMFKHEGDKRYFSKIMTYATFLVVWMGLGLSLYSKDIVKLFALNPSYWPSYQVVPVICLSYVFFGMRIIASLGMYLTGNTLYIALTTIFAAGLNLILNFIFIPKYGMMAAAYSTLAAFVVLYLLSYFYSNKHYKIPYENFKLAGVIALGIVMYIAATAIDSSFLVGLLIKLVLFLLLPYILFLFNFYEKIELQRLNSFYKKWQNPLRWRENIKLELKDIFKS